MNLFVEMLISSIIQIILFTLIPFGYWFLRQRTKQPFFQWLGLRKIPTANKSKILRLATVATVAYMLLSLFILYQLKGIDTATSDFYGKGMRAFPAALVYAFLHTALPEEILFRAFLLKWLITKTAFQNANVLQSILFGLLHGLLFFSVVSPVQAIVITVFTASIGWFMGYLNETYAAGSILPSWIMHGAANVFSALISMFAII